MKIAPPYCGHWLYNPPRFPGRVYYPVLLFEDGRSELLDAFSALTTTNNPTPGEKIGAMCLRNARLGLVKKGLERQYFTKLGEGYIMPVTLSSTVREMILALNRERLDGWEYDEVECPRCDQLLSDELTSQLAGKIKTDPAVVFSSE